MLDQAFHAAQTRGANEDFRFRRDRHCYVASILHFKREHPAKHGHLPRGSVMTRMRPQSWIMDTCHFSTLREEVRNFHCVLRMRAHPPWQCAHPAQDQPAIERRGDCAAFVLNAANPSKEIAVFFGYDNSAQDVAMATEVFCC